MEWIDQQTDPKKLMSPRRKLIIEDAKPEAIRRNQGILVLRDITSEDLVYPMRLTAGPDPSVPFGEIHELNP
jgi:hypothetical protein